MKEFNIDELDLMEQFVKICDTGTSKDCRLFVQEAKRKGISYEELCDYKRQKQNTESGG